MSNVNSYQRNDCNIYVEYPSEVELCISRDKLKPPGILSNNYNKQGLKKVERLFIPAKDVTTKHTGENMRQTNYFQANLKDSDAEEGQKKSYFNTKNRDISMSAYDRVKHVTEGYDQKLHRDDRLHAKSRGLRLHEEEISRKVPVTTNAAYGAPNRLLLEKHSKKHGHVEICEQDFKRVSGVNLKKEE